MEWFNVLKKKGKHPALKRAGVSGFSKPKRTPKHKSKSHIVVVKDGDKVKISISELGYIENNVIDEPASTKVY